MQARQAVLTNRAAADAAASHGSQDAADAIVKLARELRAKDSRLSIATSYDSARRKLAVG